MLTRSWRDERGAVLVQTAVVLIGLLAFGSFTMDYGVLWVARGQAQNAADAGALAAATSMAYGDPTDPGFDARVRNVAVAAAQANLVWGQAPAVDPLLDVTIGPCPPGAPGIPDQCVRVDVYRNQQRGNALPTFFAQLVGVIEQGVRATATAQVATGLTTTCVKPWVIPDKWFDAVDTDAPIDVGTWTAEDKFERYKVTGKNYTLLNPADYYVAPSANDPGTGFVVPDDLGRRVRLKLEAWKDSDIASGNFQGIVLPGPCGNGGGATYRCNIETCNPMPVQVNQIVETEPGNMVGPTQQGVQTLIAGDTAVWMCNDGTVAAPTSDCAGYPSSMPTTRLVPVPAFDLQQYLADAAAGLQKANGRMDIRITRVLGFFIEGVDNKEVWGRFSHYPAAGGIGNGGVDDAANFLRKVILVR